MREIGVLFTRAEDSRICRNDSLLGRSFLVLVRDLTKTESSYRRSRCRRMVRSVHWAIWAISTVAGKDPATIDRTMEKAESLAVCKLRFVA